MFIRDLTVGDIFTTGASDTQYVVERVTVGNVLTCVEYHTRFSGIRAVMTKPGLSTITKVA